MEKREDCKILGMPSKAGAKEMKAAYWKLAFQYYPEINEGDP